MDLQVQLMWPSRGEFLDSIRNREVRSEGSCGKRLPNVRPASEGTGRSVRAEGTLRPAGSITCFGTHLQGTEKGILMSRVAVSLCTIFPGTRSGLKNRFALGGTTSYLGSDLPLSNFWNLPG